MVSVRILFSGLSGLRMKFSEAFRETMFRFDLTGVELSERSGLTQTQISDLRNGKNLRIDSVDKIVAVLDQRALEYMLLLVAYRGDPAGMPLPPIECQDETAQER